MNTKPPKLFVTIKDLMWLFGYKQYNSACRRHKLIRNSIQPGKKTLTIQELCVALCLPQDQIENFFSQIEG